MKKILSIIIACIALFAACTKSASAYPPASIQPVVTPRAPFVITDNLYPNPCTGKFTIQTNSSASQNVQIYSVIGKIVFTQTISGTTNINVDTLQQGVYIARMTNGTNTIQKKLVITK